MISLNISFPKIFFPLIFAYLLFLLSSCKNDKSGNDQVNVLNDTSQQVTDALFKKYKLDKIKMPEGFKIEVYAEAPGARSLCLSNNGTVFVGTRNEKVFANIKNNSILWLPSPI